MSDTTLAIFGVTVAVLGLGAVLVVTTRTVCTWLEILAHQLRRAADSLQAIERRAGTLPEASADVDRWVGRG